MAGLLHDRRTESGPGKAKGKRGRVLTSSSWNVGKGGHRDRKPGRVWGKWGQDRLGQVWALWRQHCHTDVGPLGGGLAETTSEMGKCRYKDTQDPRGSYRCGYLGRVGEMWGVGGAWDRSHMGQEGTNQGAQDERDVGLPKVGLPETDVGCLD